jgi:hypothetical protein
MTENRVEITAEQSQLLDAGVQIAAELLRQGPEPLLPSLYAHDGQEWTVFHLMAPTVDELRSLARDTLRERMQNALAYALFFESSLAEEGVNSLTIETGDVDDEHAIGFVRAVAPDTRELAPRMSHTGSAPNLLR